MIEFFETYAGLVTIKLCRSNKGRFYEVYCNAKYVGDIHTTEIKSNDKYLIEEFLKKNGF